MRNKLLHAGRLTMVAAIILAGHCLTAGPPWVKYNVGFNYIMMGIDFPENQDNVGFMAGESLTYNGNGIVLKTTDGGTTWVQMWTGINMGLEGSSFVDLNTGFVAGWPKLSNGWSGFGKTTDGGVTWTSPPVIPDVYYFTDVEFKDASNGILAGSTNTAPAVYVTSNGGASWISASGVSNGVPMGVCHVSGNTYFLADNGGRIKKSMDNGLTWTTIFTIPGALLTGIDFFNDNIGMVCGDNGLIGKTSDGGATWQVQAVGTDIWRDFGWETQDHVFCCGTPEIVYNAPGVYDVRLIVNNGYWSDTLLKSEYITATQSVTPEISAMGTMLTSSLAAGNQWYLDDILIPGATGQTWEAVQSGWYWDVVTQNGCVSDTSNNIYILMTHAESPRTGSISLIRSGGEGEWILKFSGFRDGAYIYRIYNMNGLKVLERNLIVAAGEKTMSVDLSECSPGIYIMQVEGIVTLLTKKIQLP